MRKLFVVRTVEHPLALRWVVLVGGALTLLCIVLGAHLLVYVPYNADDAFISFRYARNFALGNGLVFNIGERVEGYSTWTWVVLLGLLNRLGFDIPLTAKLLNLALSFASALLLAWLGWRWVAGAEGDRGAWLPWAALVLAGDAAFAYWGANAMEVPLTTLLLLAGGARYLHEAADARRAPVSALVFGLLALTRPEGAWFFGLTALHRLLCRDRRPKTTPPQPSPHAGRAKGGVDCLPSSALQRHWRWFALFLLVFVPFLLWRYSYYGQWLPNTVTVKSGVHLRTLLEGGLSVYTFAAARAAALALIVVGLACAARPWPRWASYAAMLLAGNALFVGLAGGDWMPFDRFWVLMLPWWYLLLVFAVGQLVGRLRGANRHAVGALLLGGVLLLSLAGSAVARLTTNAPSINNAGPHVAAWLRRVTEPGDVIASSNIGAIGYYNMDLTIIDLVGLTDAHIARTQARFPGGLLARGNGFGHWDSAYVLSRQPRFVEIAGIDRAEGTAWTGQAAWVGANDLYHNPEFRHRYRYADHSYFERIE